MAGEIGNLLVELEEDKVLAIIGPSTSGESLKIKSLCDENETILLSGTGCRK